MRFVRTILLVGLCLSLFAGGVANAAMPCCWDKTAPMQHMDDTDMPCHQSTDDKASQNHNGPSCDCQSFLNVNAVFPQPIILHHLPSTVIAATLSDLYSLLPNDIEQPPKILS